MKKKLLTVGALALFAGTTIQAQTLIFDKGAAWSYKDNNQAQPDAWKDKTYDVSSWATGNGPLGYGDPVTTAINTGLTTAYF
ncbi:MAG TPA: twin-arginine translocation pathway signal protein, partial [Chryseobacterium indologenes]|nr:twin-arginine translocation pathway signal protein [Chryseobacterium indologenes]